jgi:hypothetical protein
MNNSIDQNVDRKKLGFFSIRTRFRPLTNATWRVGADRLWTGFNFQSSLFILKFFFQYELLPKNLFYNNFIILETQISSKNVSCNNFFFVTVSTILWRSGDSSQIATEIESTKVRQFILVLCIFVLKKELFLKKFKRIILFKAINSLVIF